MTGNISLPGDEGITITMPDGSINPEVDAQIAEIQKQVVSIRGLTPNGEFTRSFLTPEDLQERVNNDFFSEYTPEEAATDVGILSVFGLMEADYDIYGLYTALYAEQIAGFYDDETKEMVVVLEGGWAGPERITYAHEYQHALQDQNFGLGESIGYTEEACEEDSERCAGLQALIEGDASLTELMWFEQYGTLTDQRQIAQFYNNLESPVYDSAPEFLKQDFVFPYDQGYQFVNELYQRGGWQAVDNAYVEAPLSTEHILHPETYPNEIPIFVTLPDLLPLLPDGYEALDDNVMGEWYTYLILSAGHDTTFRLNEDTAKQAAAGWGGDRYAVYGDENGEYVMVMLTTWDTENDAVEFASAFDQYGNLRYGPAAEENENRAWTFDKAHVLFVQNGDQTLWIHAPSADLAETVQNAILDTQP